MEKIRIYGRKRRENSPAAKMAESTATKRRQRDEEVPWKRLGFEWFCYFTISIRVFM